MNRIRLALRLHRLGLAVANGVSGRSIRDLAHEHPVDWSSRLHARRRVDDVPRDERLAFGCARLEADDSLTRVHCDPHLQVRLLGHPVADAESCADGALRVVLVRHGCTEDGHHGVADELLDRSSVTLELRAQASVIRREQAAHVLGIHLLGARRKADEVAEEDGDDLALLLDRR